MKWLIWGIIFFLGIIIMPTAIVAAGWHPFFGFPCGLVWGLVMMNNTPRISS